jgi:hypothetical protein
VVAPELEVDGVAGDTAALAGGSNAVLTLAMSDWIWEMRESASVYVID